MLGSIAAFPRASRQVLAVLVLFFGYNGLANAQQSPAPMPIRNLPVENALLEPVADVAKPGNAGLFIGVNDFTKDKSLSRLQFAVNDAVEQAYLFVFELKLIPARNCTLLLSGTPAGPLVERHLELLKSAAAVVSTADRSEILSRLEKLRSITANDSNLLICSVSSHGFIVDGRPYVMPSDGLKSRLKHTAIELDLVEDDMEQSRAGNRLLFVDACQERVAAKAVGTAVTGQEMDAAFKTAFERATGQYKLASCSPKQLSYEHASLGKVGHGVFTFALLEALRGGADVDGQNLVRLKAVEEFVSKYLADWSKGNNLPLQTPFAAGAMASREFPLAKRAGNLATLVASVRQHPNTEVFPADLRDHLALALVKLDLRQEPDRDFVSCTQSFVNGRIPAYAFVPYLRAELERRNRSVSLPPPIPMPVVATFKVREGTDDSAPLLYGVPVILRWQPLADSPMKTLGRVITDAQGCARIELKTGVTPSSSGRYFARVGKGENYLDWHLDGFPAITSWRLYLPPLRYFSVLPGQVIENSIGSRLVFLPEGHFKMGSPEWHRSAESDERPEHRVVLTKPFYLGRGEVTQREWKTVMGTEPWKGKDFVREGDDYPAVYISYFDALEFCRRLSALPTEKALNRVYRLPTEAEWEYACRGERGDVFPIFAAGIARSRVSLMDVYKIHVEKKALNVPIEQRPPNRLYHFGDKVNELDKYAWYDENTTRKEEKFAHRSGQKLSNGYSLFDTHGNVSEWCSDWYDAGYYATDSAKWFDPTGPSSGTVRAHRGGCWDDDARNCRAAVRSGRDPSDRTCNLGFRLALNFVGVPGESSQDKKK